MPINEREQRLAETLHRLGYRDPERRRAFVVTVVLLVAFLATVALYDCRNFKVYWLFSACQPRISDLMMDSPALRSGTLVPSSAARAK